MLRFAPSPTGDMNIGDLRVALFNYIISKQRDEDLIVRIEDIDTEKNIEGKDKEILDLLVLFDIEYSHVIYQSHNVRFHSAMALQLIHDKKAFSCFCSPNWLERKREEAKENAEKSNIFKHRLRPGQGNNLSEILFTMSCLKKGWTKERANTYFIESFSLLSKYRTKILLCNDEILKLVNKKT